MEILSRTNTQALKGFAAMGIFVFHMLGYDIWPVFNMWGGLFIAVFLALSGYGIEESFREKGLDGFWMKRLGKLILPFAFFVCAYNYLFSFLLPDMSMHRCLNELPYIAHIPFISMIVDARSTILFLACSIAGFAILMIYRRFVKNRMSVVEALFLIVNVIFVAKYSARVSADAVLPATLAAVVFYYILLRLVLPYIYIGISKLSLAQFRLLTAGCLVVFAGMAALQYAVDPYSVQVDRWSALHFPIQNLLSGIYPYSASTHLGGNASPFPVWQIVHIPFYLLGNVGLSFFVAAGLFLWSCYKAYGKDKALIVSLLLCSSVAVWYEVAVRSDLMANVLLLASIINLVLLRLSLQWVEAHRWQIACAVGLLASTRLLVLVPIALLLFPYFLRLNWRRQIGVSLLAISVFLLTFLPFALWDWQEFYYFQDNPWTLQTRQGNLLDFIIFVPIAVFLSLTHKGIAKRYYRNSALMLVAMVAVTFVHNMYNEGNFDLFSSTFDITYFSPALPFCMLAIACKDENCGRGGASQVG